MYLAHSNFELVPLSSIAEINIGKTPARKEKLNFGKGTTWLSIRDLNGTKYIEDSKEELTDLGIKSSNIKLVKKGTLLFSFKLSIGKTAIANKDLYTNEAIAALPIKDDTILDLNYFYYVMSSFDFTEGGDRAVMGQTLNKSKLAKLEIPLPPLKTQQKIAAILDEADRLRQLDKQLIQKYEDLSQSLFLEMFGDPFYNNKDWEKVKLSRLIQSLDAGVSVNSNKEEYSLSKKGILKTSCVYSNYFNPLEAKVIKTTDLTRAKINPQRDSILISRMNTVDLVGKSAYINETYENLFLPDRLWMTKKGDLDHSVLWLSYVLKHESFMMNIRNIASGTSGSMKNISKKKYLNSEIIFPPYELQQKFAAQVQIIEEQIIQTNKLRGYSKELFNSLLQKAFKGELV